MYEIAFRILTDFWRVLGQMAPYLLFGFLIAGVLSVVVSPRVVQRHLGGRGLWPVLKASAFGVPLPLCSCGVIPVSASLRRQGSSRGATTAFLISTPQTGVDSILVTFSLLGWLYALLRPLIALASGVLGGAFVDRLTRDQQPQPPSAKRSDAGPVERERQGRLRKALAYGFVALPRDIGKALIVGLVVAALISALVPENFFVGVGTGLTGMLLMMLAGIPVYVCATASVPVAAALIVKGVSPGAALVFLMTGPATNAATIATVWKVMGRRTAVLYLATMAACALGGGLLLDLIVTSSNVAVGSTTAWMLPPVAGHAAAVVLLAVLAGAVLSPLLRQGGRARGDRASTRIIVEGMRCTHCTRTVQAALEQCPGVTSARVDLPSGEAMVTGGGLDTPALLRAVEALGYSASPGTECGNGRMSGNLMIGALAGCLIALAAYLAARLALRKSSLRSKLPAPGAFAVVGLLAGAAVGLHAFGAAGAAGAHAGMTPVESVEDFESTVLRADKPAVVDFYTTWCGYCEELALVLGRLAEEYEGRAVFVRVDADRAPSLRSRYRIGAYPTVLLFSGGREIRRWEGVHPSSAYRAAIDAAIAATGRASEGERNTSMPQRTGLITFQGRGLTLLGNEVNVGDKAPDFTAVDPELSEVGLSSLSGKVVVLSAVPSLDTAVCAVQTKRFNEEAAALDKDVVIVTVSMDLPFAQARWCGSEGVERIRTLSDHRSASFGMAYGVLIKELRLLSRSVFVVDREGTIRHAERVREITDEPDYEAALRVVRGLSKG
jgi:hypothetical protein